MVILLAVKPIRLTKPQLFCPSCGQFRPPVNLINVNFTITFSEAVAIVGINDLTLTSGISGAAISGISGSGSVYTVTVNTGTGNGTIHLDLKDDDSIQDATHNPLGGPGLGNGNFTSGETYTTLIKISKPILVVV